MENLLFLSLLILISFIKNESITLLNKTESEHYDFLFNSIDNDDYNISLIFNY